MEKIDQTIASYDACAKSYAKIFMDFASYKEKLIHFQRTYLQDVDTILDLGCGPGNVIKLLHEQNPVYQITGIDLSEEMLKLARQNAPQARFLSGDLRNIALSDMFDAVIASFVIVHLHDEEARQFLDRIAARLNSGGYLYLSFMEGVGSGYETTSFSEQPIFFNYYQKDAILARLRYNELLPLEVLQEDYREEDGSLTRDIFIIAQKGYSLKTRTFCVE